mmetsp:Transcript_48720/g.121999  ORF Transcript_48720/g.121999 Transcript_48720/m.121999 type:complete len:88 (-) Transcript_48720:819-1082(-)
MDDGRILLLIDLFVCVCVCVCVYVPSSTDQPLYLFVYVYAAPTRSDSLSLPVSPSTHSIHPYVCSLSCVSLIRIWLARPTDRQTGAE